MIRALLLATIRRLDSQWKLPAPLFPFLQAVFILRSCSTFYYVTISLFTLVVKLNHEIG